MAKQKETQKTELEQIANPASELQAYFDAYPQIDEFYKTSDGQVFSDTNLRDNYLRTLDNKEFETFKRNA